MPLTKCLLAVIFLWVGVTCGQSISRQAPSPQATAPDGAKSGASTATASSTPPDSTQLTIIKLEKPKYPFEAEQQQIQGRVLVHLTISETGDVESAEPVSGNPVLSAAAVRAMKNWKFKPYIKGGHPVKVSTNLAYEFAFEGHVINTPTSAGTPEFKSEGPRNTSMSQASSATGNTASGENSTLPAPQRVRVAQGVTQGLLIHKVAPVYPENARAARVQGTVILQAIIGKDGHIKDLHVISGPERLTSAAVGAVEQWRYKPYYLDGRPVEVETTINVNFVLQ